MPKWKHQRCEDSFAKQCKCIFCCSLFLLNLENARCTIKKPDKSRKMAKKQCIKMKSKTYVVVAPTATYDAVNHTIVIRGKERDRDISY